jgi:anti-anti-sigma regulatory factor
MMLRVGRQELDDASIFRLEGRLTGEHAVHLRMLVTRCHVARRLVVDVTEVMYVDAAGEDFLLLLKRLGAQFLAETSYSRDVCERLDLPEGFSK